jgi:hypothetical protein
MVVEGHFEWCFLATQEVQNIGVMSTFCQKVKNPFLGWQLASKSMG